MLIKITHYILQKTSTRKLSEEEIIQLLEIINLLYLIKGFKLFFFWGFLLGILGKFWNRIL
jgi:hypothetical protein